MVLDGSSSSWEEAPESWGVCGGRHWGKVLVSCAVAALPAEVCPRKHQKVAFDVGRLLG